VRDGGGKNTFYFEFQHTATYSSHSTGERSAVRREYQAAAKGDGAAGKFEADLQPPRNAARNKAVEIFEKSQVLKRKNSQNQSNYILLPPQTDQ